MGKLPYPPCVMNPMTELPYTRHRWTIKPSVRVKVNRQGDPVTLDRIVCARCGFNDPKATTH